MLRIGFDVDGVLADFASRFFEIEQRLLGPEAAIPAEQPEKVSQPDEEFQGLRRTREAIWTEIETTRDFWTTLRPIDDGAVKRMHALSLQHGWEVFFMTRRPSTEGQTVQRQTQRWLVEQGFDWPSVLVIDGSRGAAAKALALDYHVDDDLQNCLDVISDSTTRAILLSAASPIADSARRLGIGTAPSITECLDILEQVSLAENNPGLFRRLAALVGWE